MFAGVFERTLGLLRRQPGFDLAAIGERWLERPLTHDGVAGTLRIRQLPASLPRGDFPFVAMAWLDQALPAREAAERSEAIRQALERQGRCLLVLVHHTPDRLDCYAYAASAKALDRAFGALGDDALRWGINDDPGWREYEHARGLAGA